MSGGSQKLHKIHDSLHKMPRGVDADYISKKLISVADVLGAFTKVIEETGTKISGDENGELYSKMHNYSHSCA